MLESTSPGKLEYQEIILLTNFNTNGACRINRIVYNHLSSLPGNKNSQKQRSQTMQIVKFNLLTNNQTQYRSFLFAYQWFLLEMSQADGMQYLFNFVMFWSECLTLYIDIINAD